ncbi:tyrosine-type recombinase/integrase [Winogradskyella sp.]|uniref:tyrosine-type recombinase/integrase n=1 Tax=Winogradskyella sp. TaxID=1883156 RepID=UPI00260C2685|nr:tyrosine-type recombinase/integrase [Winogradskyella sp.]
MEYRKKKVLQQYNMGLKELALMAGIDKRVTSYVARHSYAACLKFKRVSTDIISEVLSHRDIKVTQTYLKEFGNAVLDEDSALLLDA